MDNLDDQPMDQADQEVEDELVISMLRELILWLGRKRREYRPLEEIPPDDLNRCLTDFVICGCRENGSAFDGDWLNLFKEMLDIYLKDCNYGVNLDSTAFYLFQQAVAEKSKNRIGRPEAGSTASDADSYQCLQALPEEKEEKLWIEKKLGGDNPESLVFTEVYFAIKLFKVRRKEELIDLRLGQIKAERSHLDNIRYLSYHPKVAIGSAVSIETKVKSMTPIYVFEGGPADRDPVRLFELYIEHRPANSKGHDSPLFLQPVSGDSTPAQETWYDSNPLNTKSLNRFFKRLARADSNSANSSGSSSSYTYDHTNNSSSPGRLINQLDDKASSNEALSGNVDSVGELFVTESDPVGRFTSTSHYKHSGSNDDNHNQRRNITSDQLDHRERSDTSNGVHNSSNLCVNTNGNERGIGYNLEESRVGSEQKNSDVGRSELNIEQSAGALNIIHSEQTTERSSERSGFEQSDRRSIESRSEVVRENTENGGGSIITATTTNSSNNTATGAVGTPRTSEAYAKRTTNSHSNIPRRNATLSGGEIPSYRRSNGSEAAIMSGDDNSERPLSLYNILRDDVRNLGSQDNIQDAGTGTFGNILFGGHNRSGGEMVPARGSPLFGSNWRDEGGSYGGGGGGRMSRATERPTGRSRLQERLSSIRSDRESSETRQTQRAPHHTRTGRRWQTIGVEGVRWNGSGGMDGGVRGPPSRNGSDDSYNDRGQDSGNMLVPVESRRRLSPSRFDRYGGDEYFQGDTAFRDYQEKYYNRQTQNSPTRFNQQPEYNQHARVHFREENMQRFFSQGIGRQMYNQPSSQQQAPQQEYVSRQERFAHIRQNHTSRYSSSDQPGNERSSYSSNRNQMLTSEHTSSGGRRLEERLQLTETAHEEETTTSSTTKNLPSPLPAGLPPITLPAPYPAIEGGTPTMTTTSSVNNALTTVNTSHTTNEADLPNVKELLQVGKIQPKSPTAKRKLILDESRLEDLFLKCFICGETYNSTTKLPKLLPCHHAICLSCLLEMFRVECEHRQNVTAGYRSHLPSAVRIACPTCRNSTMYSHDEIKRLPSDRTVMALLDVVNQSETYVVTYCSRHQTQPLNFFCETCIVPVCCDCTVLDHQQKDEHVVMNIEEALKKYVPMIDTTLNDMATETTDLVTKKSKLDAVIKTIEMNRGEVLTKLKETFQHFRAAADDREEELVEISEREIGRKREELTTYLTTVVAKRDKLQASRQNLIHAQDVEHVEDVFKYHKSLKQILYEEVIVPDSFAEEFNANLEFDEKELTLVLSKLTEFGEVLFEYS